VATTGLLVAGTAWAASGSRDEVPTGTVQVDGADVPVHGSFRYHQFHLDTNPEIRGLVHGAHRVDGGTVVYYSLGLAADSGEDRFRGSMAFPNSSHPYKISHATNLRLVDVDNKVGYLPLHSADRTFTSEVTDFDGLPGELRVGYAVFPELEPGVTTVEVVMPWGTQVPGVPVADGPLEPVGEDAAPRLGAGWPAVPQGADLADARPDEVRFTLVERFSDLDGSVSTEESVADVTTTLDANVLFEFDSAELSPAAHEALATVAADVAARGRGEVVVTGHTDSDGSRAYNQTLSEQRAAAVLAVLEPASGTRVTFTAVGKGASDPVASNSTDEGKQQNRRVTVVYGIVEDS